MLPFRGGFQQLSGVGRAESQSRWRAGFTFQGLPGRTLDRLWMESCNRAGRAARRPVQRGRRGERERGVWYARCMRVWERDGRAREKARASGGETSGEQKTELSRREGPRPIGCSRHSLSPRELTSSTRSPPSPKRSPPPSHRPSRSALLARSPLPP
ncbi:hypothetical protein FKP32DRAFT_191844 [Trametes sanguinea]|nr:hypothetical protein FKP32DRAFT_191844 [Trametes sanguinea]